MRLASFLPADSIDGAPRIGLVLANDMMLDVTAARDGAPFASMLELIDAGDDTLAVVAQAAARESGDRYALADVRLLAPIPRPRKNVFCVGRNYHDHIAEGYRAREQAIEIPEYPQFFSKPPTAVSGPGDTIPAYSGLTKCLDYEVELAVVIGKAGRDIAPERWADHVFGYTIINDITARDLQRRHGQWFKGKGLDGSLPMGPWIVHKSAISDPQALAISLQINGETRQHANTSQMIFDLPRIIVELSAGMTLEAGDVIATGTPAGVGYAMTPPRPLQPGDRIRCEIEGIGVLESSIR